MAEDESVIAKEYPKYDPSIGREVLEPGKYSEECESRGSGHDWIIEGDILTCSVCGRQEKEK